MKKWKYKGKGQKRINCATGTFVIVNKGDVFNMKEPINCEDIEEIKAKKLAEKQT